MTLRPLGDRILIKPEAQADTTESGLILMEHRKPENMGTVVAVGFCAHPQKVSAEALATRLDEWAADWTAGQDDFGNTMVDLLAAAALLREVTHREPSVKVGDTVLFSWTTGQELHLEDDDERYLLLREQDLLAVVEYA